MLRPHDPSWGSLGYYMKRRTIEHAAVRHAQSAQRLLHRLSAMSTVACSGCSIRYSEEWAHWAPFEQSCIYTGSNAPMEHLCFTLIVSLNTTIATNSSILVRCIVLTYTLLTPSVLRPLHYTNIPRYGSPYLTSWYFLANYYTSSLLSALNETKVLSKLNSWLSC